MVKSLSLFVLILAMSSPSWGAVERKPAFFGIFKRNKTTSGENVMECQKCSVPFSDENWVQFESIEKCPVERRYLQDQLMALPEMFKNKRQNTDGLQFPVACVVHAQRTLTMRVKENPSDSEATKWAGYEVPFRFFARCNAADGRPERGMHMPCVTPEYSYTVYHAFNDVADCMGINGRKLLPKLWNESGFHINALGGGFDGGVGQLTKSALDEVLSKPFADDDRTALEIYKNQAYYSEKPSCKRLLEYEGSYDVVSTLPENRCSIMSTPANPVRNLVYMGIFYKLNERFVEGRMATTGMKDKLMQLGLQEPDMEYFKDVIVTLSFNAGRGTAFSMVDNFLKARLVEGRSLQRAELDFLANSIEPVRKLRYEPKNETEAQRDKRIAILSEARELAHQRNLPQYLRLMHGLNADFETDPERKRISGAPGYVSFVGARQQKFDTELGEGTCTDTSFLQHR